MTKTELIEKMASTAEISKAQAGKALAAAIETITKDIKKGNRLTITGFGTFYVSKRKARKGHNPRTGEAIKIAAAKVPKFSAGKSLRDAINK